jgi:predicted aminopeptidase
MAVALALVLGVAHLTAGCSSVGYYARSVGGHLAIVGSARR